MPDFSYIEDFEERFKADLKFQLEFDHIDWDYFIGGSLHGADSTNV